MSDLTLTNALAGARAYAPPAAVAARGAVDLTDTAADRAAKDFEAVFLNTMLQQMFTGIEEGGAWGGGTGSEAWQSLLIDEYSKAISQSGGIGIADSVKRELIALQEIN